MELVPQYGEKPLTFTDISVRIRSSDRKRINELAQRAAKEVTRVDSPEAFTIARRLAGEIKAAKAEIYDSKRAAKKPFEAVLNSIEDLAKELNGVLDEQEARLLALLKLYAKGLEEKQKEEQRLERARKAAEEKAHQEQVRKLEAEGKAEAARLAELQHSLDSEVRAMAMTPQPGLIPGGRLLHPWKFKLLDPVATVKANCIRLLKIDLDILACQDAVRAQLEIAPDHTPSLPGIEVTRETSVQIKATSRIK